MINRKFHHSKSTSFIFVELIFKTTNMGAKFCGVLKKLFARKVLG